MAVIVWARAIGRQWSVTMGVVGATGIGPKRLHFEGHGPRPWVSPEQENLAEIECVSSKLWPRFSANFGELVAGGWVEVVEDSEVSLLVVGSDGQGGRKVVGGARVVVKWREKWREMNEKGSAEIDLGN
ncbi:Hypothetical predicted protein [Olea europaea subsp. europaea]|uniref:Uncharacterized protein n=1 Tax=Olea europaea subsp. europaea TaxID=158383 RepID=A0A8S0UH84_OLEEU|nr:Hypothetical predicted protein [Olea europaea subsp. europaea]